MIVFSWTITKKIYGICFFRESSLPRMAEISPMSKSGVWRMLSCRECNKASHEALLFWFYYLAKITDPITFSFPSKLLPACRIVVDVRRPCPLARPGRKSSWNPSKTRSELTLSSSGLVA